MKKMFVAKLIVVLTAATQMAAAAQISIPKIFASFSRWINTAGLIKQDLEAAKIGLTDKDENEICFHSLRNSYISYLANSSTPAKVVQKLARHSDPRLTFNTYARTFDESE
jgi:integrase